MNQEQKRAYMREWRAKNAKKVAAYNAKWRADNPDKVAGYAKNRKPRDKDKAAQYMREWVAKNKKERAAYLKAWAIANPGRKARSAALLRAKNPEKARIEGVRYAQLRRSRKRGNGGILSRDIVAKLMALQHGCCAVCRKKLRSVHLDHIIPLAAGGPTEDHNMQLLCPPCNRSKGAKDPVTFMQSRGMLL